MAQHRPLRRRRPWLRRRAVAAEGGAFGYLGGRQKEQQPWPAAGKVAGTLAGAAEVGAAATAGLAVGIAGGARSNPAERSCGAQVSVARACTKLMGAFVPFWDNDAGSKIHLLANPGSGRGPHRRGQAEDSLRSCRCSWAACSTSQSMTGANAQPLRKLLCGRARNLLAQRSRNAVEQLA